MAVAKRGGRRPAKRAANVASNLTPARARRANLNSPGSVRAAANGRQPRGGRRPANRNAKAARGGKKGGAS
jgi:hypothetical protein